MTIFKGYILVIITYGRLYYILFGTIRMETISQKVYLWNPY